MKALENVDEVNEMIKEIVKERTGLEKSLPELPVVDTFILPMPTFCFCSGKR